MTILSICDNLFEQKIQQTLWFDEKFFWIEYPFVFLRRKFISGSSRLEVFCKKGVLRNFANFIGKHLCQSLFFNKITGLGLQFILQAYACNFIKKQTLAQVFSCEFCKISKNTFFHGTPLVAISVFPRCYVAKQLFGIEYFTDILSFEKFSKNLHQNLKFIFLFSTLFVHFKIGYRQSFIKGRIHWNFSFRGFHEIQFQRHFMKHKILSWNIL